MCILRDELPTVPASARPHRGQGTPVRIPNSLTAFPAATLLGLAVLAAPQSAAVPERADAGAVQFGGPAIDRPADVATYGAASYSFSTTIGSPTTATLEKRRPDGSLAWSRGIGGDATAWAEAVTADASGVYVAGLTTGAVGDTEPAGGNDVFVRKYDHAGAVLWTKQFGTSGHEATTNIAVADGAVHLVGHTSGALGGPSSGEWDMWAIKILPSQATAWVEQFGTSGFDQAGGVAVVGGDVYVSGTVHGAFPDGGGDVGGDDAVVLRLDGDSGDIGWVEQFGSAANEYADALTTDGTRVYVGGTTDASLPGEASTGEADGFVKAFTATGAPAWVEQFGTAGTDWVTDVTWDGDGLVVTGSTDRALAPAQHGGSFDLYVRRYGRAGDVQWTRQRGTALNDFATGTAAGPYGLFVVGYTGGDLAGANKGGDDGVLLRWAEHRSDALVRAGGARWVGDDAYRGTQAAASRVRRGSTATFVVRAANDGEEAERLAVRGCSSPRGLAVRFLAGGKDVTRAVRSGAFRTAVVEVGRHQDLTVKITVTRRAPLRTSACAVTVSTTEGPVTRDTVTATVRVVR